jgi:Zn-dependent protease/CBS domain-containing protein
MRGRGEETKDDRIPQPQAHPHGLQGWKLGRWFGIDFKVEPSWVFIFILLIYNLTFLFSRWHREWPTPASALLAVAAAILFFLSVLAHELAHALVAKGFQIPVRSITLFLFGGVSNIEKEPPSPRAEFLMAIVGPIVSVALGFGFLLVAGAVSPLPPDGELEGSLARLGPGPTLLMWLGSINVTVGIFNLIPGFPLDGGRVLRAILWRVTHDLRKATRWAGAVGQAIGWAFILIGLAMVFGAAIPPFGRGVFGGLWLAFIGWFLHSAAAASQRQMMLDEALAGVTVASLMRRNVASIPEDTSVRAAVSGWFMGSDERGFLVSGGDGGLAGLVSFSDVRALPQDRWEAARVGQIMTPFVELAVTSPREEVSAALRKLVEKNVSQLPVLDQGQVVGMLERRDIARWLEIRMGHILTPRGSTT